MFRKYRRNANPTRRHYFFRNYINYLCQLKSMRGRWASAAIGASVARSRAGARENQQAQANQAQQQASQQQIEAQQRQIEALQQQAGHLKIIDRAKDVGRLMGGAATARCSRPSTSRTSSSSFPFIKEAVAFGDRRERVCAFINIDVEAVGNWAEKRNLPYAATPIWRRSRRSTS